MPRFDGLRTRWAGSPGNIPAPSLSSYRRRDMKSDEKELIRRSKEGDAAAFGEIVRRYQQPVYAAAFQIVRDPAAVQDLAQETFISAFLALRDLESEDAFPSWTAAGSRTIWNAT